MTIEYSREMRLPHVAILCVALAIAGCSGASGRPPLADVALPNVSRLDPSVQTQITQGHATLTRTRESADASDAEVGAAYGEFGVLLHAAGFLEGADAAYANAQALLPVDARWPYYRALVARARGNAPQAVTCLLYTSPSPRD